VYYFAVAQPFIHGDIMRFLIYIIFLSAAVSSCSILPRGRTASQDIYTSSVTTPEVKAWYHFSRSRMLQSQGAYTQALAALQRAIELDPAAPELYVQAAGLYMLKGQMEKAADSAQDALLFDSEQPQALRFLANFYFRKNNFSQAIPFFTRLLVLFPEEEFTCLHLTLAFQRNGDIDKAFDTIQLFLKEHPGSRKGRLTLAQLYRQAHLPLLAKEQYALLLKENPAFSPAVKEMVSLLNSLGRTQDSISILLEAIEADPADLHWRHQLIALYMYEDRSDEAQVALQRILDEQPGDREALRKMGFLYMEQKKWKAAELCFEKYQEILPGGEGYYYLGLVAEGQKNWGQAEKYFKKVSDDTDISDEAVSHLSYLFMRDNRAQEGIALLEDYLGAHHSRPELFLQLAAFYERVDNKDKALALYDRGLRRFPEYADLLYYKGILYERSGRTVDAEEMMKKALKLQSGHPEALNYLAYSYALRGENLDMALAMARKALSSKPAAHIYDTLGWVLYKRGEFATARINLEKAVSRLPDDSIVLEHLGDICLEMQDVESATLYYQRSFSADKDNLSVRDKLNRLKEMDH